MVSEIKKISVVLIDEVMMHYRVDFHEQLRAKLKESGVDYNVVYSAADGDYTAKKDTVDLGFGKKVYKRKFGPLVFQMIPLSLLKSDLVIMVQGNRLFVNYLMIVVRRFFGNKWAFWGHGRNYQGNPNSLQEKWKKRFANRADWWFAYTNQVAMELTGGGFNSSKITSVQNTISSSKRLNTYTKVPNKCIYVGAMYLEKRIELLLESADLIKQQIPDFTLTLIGNGPDSKFIDARKSDYIEWLDVNFSDIKSKELGEASLFLLPGLVGLAAIDSFNSGTPIITCKDSKHSPEFSYLVNDFNSIILDESNPLDYARAVIEVLGNQRKLNDLSNGCRASADIYTMDAMVQNFHDGILKALHD
jgi:glycosyltransferase involved in cell wall biosynthesis